MLDVKVHTRRSRAPSALASHGRLNPRRCASQPTAHDSAATSPPPSQSRPPHSPPTPVRTPPTPCFAAQVPSPARRNRPAHPARGARRWGGMLAPPRPTRAVAFHGTDRARIALGVLERFGEGVGSSVRSAVGPRRPQAWYTHRARCARLFSGGGPASQCRPHACSHPDVAGRVPLPPSSGRYIHRAHPMCVPRGRPPQLG